MDGDRRFVLGMHYTRRDQNVLPREEELEIQFGTVGSPGGSSGSGQHATDAQVDRDALQAFRNIAVGQQQMIGVLQQLSNTLWQLALPQDQSRERSGCFC